MRRSGRRTTLVSVQRTATEQWPGPERFYPTHAVAHMRPGDRAQRHAEPRDNCRLRQSTLAQQHHLDALARCAGGIFQRNTVFSRTSALLHLTICFARIRWCKSQGREEVPCQSPAANPQKPRVRPLWRSECPANGLVLHQIALEQDNRRRRRLESWESALSITSSGSLFFNFVARSAP